MFSKLLGCTSQFRCNTMLRLLCAKLRPRRKRAECASDRRLKDKGMKITVGGSTVSINGREFSGRNISIVGDKVVIDGVEQGKSLVGPINVVVNGNAESVETSSGSVEVAGSAGRVKTMSGSVRCGDVSGDVSNMSGDINCHSIAGKAKTMSGDIRGLGR